MKLWLKRILMMRLDSMLAYRKVINRYPHPNGKGEIIELECGHAFHLVPLHRLEFPCKECTEVVPVASLEQL